MTRAEDISIHDASASTLREKKRSDLENRVGLVNSTQGAILVSIHQNSLPSSKQTHGAQVFLFRAGVHGSQPPQGLFDGFFDIKAQGFVSGKHGFH